MTTDRVILEAVTKESVALDLVLQQFWMLNDEVLPKTMNKLFFFNVSKPIKVSMEEGVARKGTNQYVYIYSSIL